DSAGHRRYISSLANRGDDDGGVRDGKHSYRSVGGRRGLRQDVPRRGAAREGGRERGSTVSDFDPLEKTYQHSLRASLAHLEADGTRIHMIDTPGLPDFIGQAIGALDAV